MLDEAAKACLAVEGHKERIVNLQACILHDQGDITGMNIDQHLLAMCFLNFYFFSIKDDDQKT